MLKKKFHDVNQSRGGNSFTTHRQDGTALHWAAYYGQLDIAKLLIENGASMLLNVQTGQICFIFLTFVILVDCDVKASILVQHTLPI